MKRNPTQTALLPDFVETLLRTSDPDSTLAELVEFLDSGMGEGWIVREGPDAYRFDVSGMGPP